MFPTNTKILVVDDLGTMRALIKEMLNRIGYQDIHEANDGDAALEILNNAGESPFQLIISDWNMPRVTGIELLKECTKTPSLKSIPFLFITIESERAYVLKAISLGAADFIVKPFSESTLKEKLEKIYERINS